MLLNQTSLESKLKEFLYESIEKGVEIPDEIIDDFLARSKASIKKQFSKKLRSKEFKLRMSNIGKDLRQLHLESEHGEDNSGKDPSFKLKMVIGDITENVMIMLMKACGVRLRDENKKVSLNVSGTVIDGEMDIALDEYDVNGVIDVKSASDNAYIRKFASGRTLYEDDSFGYLGQLVGYADANGKDTPIGWLVVNKSTGDFKLVQIDPSTIEPTRAKIKRTVEHFKNKKPIPPCEGVIEEIWYKKPTGNLILGPKCTYCAHKGTCHKNLQSIPSLVSKGDSEGKIKHYVHIDEKYRNNEKN